MPDNRDTLAQRIEAGEERNRQRAGDGSMMERAGEKAIEAKDGLTHFAMEHPLTAVIGGFALGTAISMLLPRHPIRKTGRALGNAGERIGETGHEVGQKLGEYGGTAAGLAATFGDMAMAYIREAVDGLEEALQTSKTRLQEAGDAVSQTAKDAAREGSLYAEKAVDTAKDMSRKTAAAAKSRETL